MARNVVLRMEDLQELLKVDYQTDSGKRLRVWIQGEIERRERSGRLGGRTRRDSEPIQQQASEPFDFGA